MNLRTQAILLLLDFGHDVFLPIDGSNKLGVRANDNIKLCLIRKACNVPNEAPIVHVASKRGHERYPLTAEDCDCILCIDNELQKLWLIPRFEIDAYDSIRLGQKWESFVVQPLLGTTTSESMVAKRKQQVLQDAARALALDDVEEHLDKDEVERILDNEDIQGS